MKDLDTMQTRRGTPIIVVGARVLFAAYFIFAWWAASADVFMFSQLAPIWVLYQLGLYAVAEYLYYMFGTRGIDLAFALPLLFAMYCLNIVTLLLGGQDRLPLLNRAEHFAIFVLLGFVVWVFFVRYLPQDVWRDHPYYTALLVLSVTSLAGVVNEIAELVIDRLFQANLVGEQYDTSLDLLMNTVGTSMFLAVRLIVGSLERTTKRSVKAS